jgi:hypothetical protein
MAWARRTAIVLATALILALTSIGVSASSTLPVTDSQTRTTKVDRADLRTAGNGKDLTEKRLRMRQVLLLWVLAAQPAR